MNSLERTAKKRRLARSYHSTHDRDTAHRSKSDASTSERCYTAEFSCEFQRSQNIEDRSNARIRDGEQKRSEARGVAQSFSNNLPDFIHPLLTDIDPLNLEILRRRGALDVPEKVLRQVLVEAYFDFVNPFMPLFDKSTWLTRMGESPTVSNHQKETSPLPITNDCNEKISLLLFQAVLFAGSAFAPISAIKSMGFDGRGEARKAFYQRARCLYDLDLEVDRLSLAQSLLLLTHWVEVEDPRGPWHWQAAAVTQIQVMGIWETLKNRNSSVPNFKAMKRLWWSCFIRDTLLTLGSRCPSRFTPDDCDIDMLRFEDFESLEATSLNGDQVTIISTHVAVSVELAKLCVCLNKICSAQSTVATLVRSFLLTGHELSLSPYRTLMAMAIRDCSNQLKSWVRNMHKDACWQPSHNNQSDRSSLNLHRILLQMSYLTAVNALYRPQILPSDAEAPFAAPSDSKLYRSYARKLTHSAQETCQFAEKIVTLQLGEYLPSFSISLVIPAALVQLIQIKQCNESSARERLTADYMKCCKYLDHLKARYSCAERATSYLDSVVQEAFAESDNGKFKDIPSDSQSGWSATPGVELQQKIVPISEELSGIWISTHTELLQASQEASEDATPPVNQSESEPSPSDKASLAAHQMQPFNVPQATNSIPHVLALSNGNADLAYQWPNSKTINEMLPEIDLTSFLRDSDVVSQSPSASSDREGFPNISDFTLGSLDSWFDSSTGLLVF